MMKEVLIDFFKRVEMPAIFGIAIPFVLGLFASFFVDEVKRRIENRRKKKFILNYLRETVLVTSSDVEETYSLLSKIISKQTHGSDRISVFETFTAKVLNAIEAPEYFDIFQDEYKNLNEIIAIVEFLSDNLPNDIAIAYYGDINQHLKDNEEIGNIDHVTTCPYCKQRKANALKILEFRIEESQTLQKKIKALLAIEE